MMPYAFSWGFMGCISLFILLREEYKNKELDNRKNTFMFGATVALFFLSSWNVWSKLGTIFGVLIFRWVLGRSKLFSSHHLESFGWLTTGWLLAGFGSQFLIVMGLVVLLYYFFRHSLNVRSVPFFLFLFLMNLSTYFLFLIW